MTNEDVTTTAARGMSRRSLLKTGSTVAWTVPIIQVATAAPALAVSVLKPVLGFTALTASYNGSGDSVRPDLLDVSATVKNTGNAATQNLQVTLSIPAGVYDKAPTNPTTPSGWNPGGWTPSNGGWSQ